MLLFCQQSSARRHGQDLSDYDLTIIDTPAGLEHLSRKIGKSRLIFQMWFGDFNKPFKPARTEFDWLSRDPAEVDAYVADPLCGFPFTNQLAVDLLDALPGLLAPDRLARIRKDLPIYVFSGERDPVGANIQGLIADLEGAGFTKLTTRIYPGARHETLNETNREEVFADLIAWLDGVVGEVRGRGRAALDVVDSSLSGPYHFPAQNQSFHAFATPFSGRPPFGPTRALRLRAASPFVRSPPQDSKVASSARPGRVRDASASFQSAEKGFQLLPSSVVNRDLSKGCRRLAGKDLFVNPSSRPAPRSPLRSIERGGRRAG